MANPHQRLVWMVADGGGELPQQAALADSGLPHHRHEMRPLLLHDPGEERREELRLVLAPDQRRRGASDPRRRLDLHAHGLPGRHGLRLALEFERLQLLVLDRAAGEPLGDRADGDAAGPGGRLEARRNVDGVAHDGVVAPDLPREHLARVDADTKQERGVGPVGDVGVDLVHRPLHRQPGPHRTLGVVLVRDRRAEDSHDVVADEFVDAPAVAINLLAEALKRAIDHGLDRLRVRPLGDRRVAGQVGEQDRRLTPLLGKARGGPWGREVRPPRRRRRGARLGVGRGGLGAAEAVTALDTELRAGRVLGPALGAGGRERRPTGHAEARPLGVAGPTGGAGDLSSHDAQRYAGRGAAM